MKSLLKKLVETAGPSGFEHQVRSLILDEISTHVDDFHIDNLGNLIARKGQRSAGGLKIMLAAHMDEISLIVTHIDEAGFVRFAPVGAVRRTTSLAGRVQFMNGAVGVIGSELFTDPGYAPAFSEMFIDMGAANRKECPVQVGDVAVFERSFLDLGNRLVGKALDDRVGVALLIQAIKDWSEQGIESPHEIHFVFSAQEEIGSRGAAVAAYGIDPDLGLAIDLTASSGVPKGIKMAVEMGKGPAIKVRDQYTLSDPRVVDWMVKTAQQASLPHQLEILETGFTDAHVIQLTRSGVPVGGLSIPSRYIHTTSEMIDTSDLQQALRLLVELIRKPFTLT